MYLEMINTRQDNESVNVKDLSYCLKITNIMMDTKISLLLLGTLELRPPETELLNIIF